MRTIWKFPLEVIDSQTVTMPDRSSILAVQVQGNKPCLWAMVDTEAHPISVEIRTHGTGHELPKECDSYAHLGTYSLQSGGLIFHVFRVRDVGELLASFIGGRL